MNISRLISSSAFTLLLFLAIVPISLMAEELPKDITWLSNETDPLIASPEAKTGGTLFDYIETFPLTIRTVGPDAASDFRDVISENQYALVELHPNTDHIIPVIATHWAFGKDKKTMYFKINTEARWSDGKPVTADDFVYILEFMRSKNIVAPFHNDYYTNKIDKIIKYNDYTISISTKTIEPELLLYVDLAPIPRHFYGELTEDFVKKYNWTIVPNTGPYQIENIDKGKSITLARKKDWWGYKNRYFKNRFNVDRIVYEVIRDNSSAMEYFKKKDISFITINIPELWHVKATGDVFDKGYVHKLWFYNDVPQQAQGFWFNESHEILKDRNVRLGISHSINLDKVLEKILRGDYERLPQQYVGYGVYTNKKIKPRSFDLSKADEYFKKAGWDKRGADGIRVKGARRLSFTVSYGSAHLTDRFVVVKEEAKKAGVELNLNLMDFSAAYKMTQEKKHEIAFMTWSTKMTPAHWEHYHSDLADKPNTNNITNTKDPELDKLTIAYRDSTNKKERVKLSHKIQELIYERAVFVPFFMVPFIRDAYWRWWRFPTPPATKATEDSNFAPYSERSGGLFWFDEDLKKETEDAMKSGTSFAPVTIIDKTFKPKSKS